MLSTAWGKDVDLKSLVMSEIVEYREYNYILHYWRCYMKPSILTTITFSDLALDKIAREMLEIKIPWFCNLRVASCELRVVSCTFNRINLPVMSSFLRVTNLRK